MSTPFPKRRLTRNGLSLFEAGQGPTVVLLHGVGLCADVWRAQQRHLSADYRVLSIDLPGHGGSATISPAQPPTLGLFADIIETAVLECSDDPVILVGHSLGALISINIANNGRVPVRGLFPMSSIYQRAEAAKQAVGRRAEELTNTNSADLARSPLNRWFGPQPSGPQCDYAHQCRGWLQHSFTRGYPLAYQVFAEQTGPSAANLKALRMPAWFVTGELDPNSQPAMSESMAAITPNGQACIVSGAAHMLGMTHATQVNSLLSEFCGQC